MLFTWPLPRFGSRLVLHRRPGCADCTVFWDLCWFFVCRVGDHRAASLRARSSSRTSRVSSLFVAPPVGAFVCAALWWDRCGVGGRSVVHISPVDQLAGKKKKELKKKKSRRAVVVVNGPAPCGEPGTADLSRLCINVPRTCIVDGPSPQAQYTRVDLQLGPWCFHRRFAVSLCPTSHVPRGCDSRPQGSRVSQPSWSIVCGSPRAGCCTSGFCGSLVEPPLTTGAVALCNLHGVHATTSPWSGTE